MYPKKQENPIQEVSLEGKKCTANHAKIGDMISTYSEEKDWCGKPPIIHIPPNTFLCRDCAKENIRILELYIKSDIEMLNIRQKQVDSIKKALDYDS